MSADPTKPVDFHEWRGLVSAAALIIPTSEDREAGIVGGIARFYRVVGHPFPALPSVMASVEEHLMDWNLGPLPDPEEVTRWRHAFAYAIALARKEGAA